MHTLPLAIERFVEWYAECSLTGIQPITFSRFLLEDKRHVIGGSTAEGVGTKLGDGTIRFTAALNDVKQWYRIDFPDVISLTHEVGFRFPPAPCDGILEWEGFRHIAIHNFVNGAESGGVTIFAGHEDVPNMDPLPPPPGQIPELFPALVHSGQSIDFIRGAPGKLRSQFSVKKGQVSGVVFLLILNLRALGGLVATQALVTFNEKGDNFTGMGLRYAFRRELPRL